MQKSISNHIVRKEVRSAIKNALNVVENVTTDEDAFTTIATSVKIENTTENFVQFQNAINEISEASYEACYGSNSSLVVPAETPVLINKFKEAVTDSKSNDARHIFGRLLCLRQKFQTDHTLVVKRQADDDDDSGDGGIDEYEIMLDMWFEDLSVEDIPILFFDDVEEDAIPTLAFVVDDTGSMSGEINAVKYLIKAIIKAEKTSPFYYILGTFNDPGNRIYNYYVHYLVIFSYVSKALMQKHYWCKKVQPSKVKSYLEVYA